MLSFKMIRTMAALMACVMLLPSVGLAYDEEYDWISDHITVQFLQNGVWIDASKGLLYSHEHGWMADGALMFMPLVHYLAENPAPEIVARNEPFFRVIFDNYVASIDYYVTCYQYSDGDVTALTTADGDPISFLQLEEGTYLVAVDIIGYHEGEDYCGVCFAWVTKTTPAEPAPAPEPSPAPTTHEEVVVQWD